MKSLIITLLFIVISTELFSQDGLTFTRSAEFGRLKITMSDFKKMASTIKYYHNEIIKDTLREKKYFRLTCNISGNSGKAISLSDFSQIEALNLDESYSALTLNYHSNDRGLSDIDVVFASYKRGISVSGSDQMKVEALYRQLEEDLKGKESFLASRSWTTAIETISFMIFLFGAMFMSFLVNDWINNRATLGLKILTIFLAFYIVMSVMFAFSSRTIDDLLPMFQLTPNDLGWWDKNASLFGLIGFILTVLGFIPAVISFINWIRARHESTAITVDDSTNPTDSPPAE